MSKLLDEICIWPDGDWCFRSNLWEYGWKSDDYTTAYLEPLEDGGYHVPSYDEAMKEK